MFDAFMSPGPKEGMDAARTVGRNAKSAASAANRSTHCSPCLSPKPLTKNLSSTHGGSR